MSAAVQFTQPYGDPADRRENSRFPFRQEVRYRLLSRAAIGASAGETLNMSSTGLLFTTKEQLPWGQLVEVAVNWPAKHDSGCAPEGSWPWAGWCGRNGISRRFESRSTSSKRAGLSDKAWLLPGALRVSHSPRSVEGPSRQSPVLVPVALAACPSPPVYCLFRATAMPELDKIDPLEPQREAAFFYGLFLRGHDVDALRQDIDVPRAMLDKWMRARDFQVSFRDNLRRVYDYRKRCWPFSTVWFPANGYRRACSNPESPQCSPMTDSLASDDAGDSRAPLTTVQASGRTQPPRRYPWSLRPVSGSNPPPSTYRGPRRRVGCLAASCGNSR